MAGATLGSIIPVLVPYRKAIRRFAAIPPLGHKAVHQGDEAAVVGGLQQVGHFMHHDVFQAFPWLPGQIGIEPDACGAGLQLPHLVFILCTKNRSTFTPMSGSHFAISGGGASLGWELSHSSRMACFFSSPVAGRVWSSIWLCFSSTRGAASFSMSFSR